MGLQSVIVFNRSKIGKFDITEYSLFNGWAHLEYHTQTWKISSTKAVLLHKKRISNQRKEKADCGIHYFEIKWSENEETDFGLEKIDIIYESLFNFLR